MGVRDRLSHAWNAFVNTEDPMKTYVGDYGGYYSHGSRQDRRPLLISGAEKATIIGSIYTRVAIDVSGIAIRHVKTDDEKRYEEDVDSALNECLTIQANIDQPARHFRRDIASTLFDRGVAAIVPVDTTLSPRESGGFDIKTMRVGEIVSWYPKHVRINLYNENRGVREEITLPKSAVAIVENPLYSVMNESSSTLQRLIRKLALLDSIDEQSGNGKLDLIIQLPYTIKSDAQREKARQRREDIEFQLKGSQYGIAFADATEKIVQLNRPAENNLMDQIEFLQNKLYAELGLTPEVMNGTADEAAMLNYHARTIEPILDAIVEAMRAKFLTKTARTQGHSIMYFRDAFKFIPLGGENGLAKIADVLARNEVVASNEIRQAIGMKPSKEPKADKLINSNMPTGDTGVSPGPGAPKLKVVEPLDEVNSG